MRGSPGPRYALLFLLTAAQACSRCTTGALDETSDGGNGAVDASLVPAGDAGGTADAAQLPDARVASDAGSDADAGDKTDAGTSSCVTGCGAWHPTGSMPGERNRHTATLLTNGKVLVAGGDDGIAPMASALLYDPALETWTPTGDLHTGRYTHTATLLADGRVLVTGGVGVPAGGSFGALASSEIYTPATGQWTLTGNLANPRTGHTATAQAMGRVLIAGGDSGTEYLPALEVYNPASGTFLPAGMLTQPRYVHASALLADGKVLIAGGRHIADTLASVEIFDRVLVNPGADLPEAAWGLTADSLADGRVVVAGGYHLGALGQGYVWTPASATWSTAHALSTPRWWHASVVLANGRVMLVGGTRGGSGDGTLSACELFDPATETFSDAAWMTHPRLSHSATLLADGRVLVAGGTAGFEGLATAELYTP